MLNVAEATTISEVINTIELNTGKQIDEISFEDGFIKKISFYYDDFCDEFDFKNDIGEPENVGCTK